MHFLPRLVLLRNIARVRCVLALPPNQWLDGYVAVHRGCWRTR